MVGASMRPLGLVIKVAVDENEINAAVILCLHARFDIDCTRILVGVKCGQWIICSYMYTLQEGRVSLDATTQRPLNLSTSLHD